MNFQTLAAAGLAVTLIVVPARVGLTDEPSGLCKVAPRQAHRAADDSSAPVIDAPPCWRDGLQYSEGASDIDSYSQYLHGVGRLRKEYGVRGSGVMVGVWDEGWAVYDHLEFDKGRVSMADPSEVGFLLSDHATHVTGTIAAHGYRGSAQGIAPEAEVRSYTWGDDVGELQKAVAAGITVTNHSYGQRTGWEYDGSDAVCDIRWQWFGGAQNKFDVYFGLYNKEAATFDEVAYANPKLSVFVSAGNHRGQGPSHPAGKTECLFSQAVAAPGMPFLPVANANGLAGRDGGAQGFDTLSAQAVAKNVLTIGAMDGLPSDYSHSDVRPTHFSSYGPTDDGRIKPDVVAHGDDLYAPSTPKFCQDPPSMGGKDCPPGSLSASERHAYVRMSGTSMSSPVAAGIGALLNELARKTRSGGGASFR